MKSAALGHVRGPGKEPWRGRRLGAHCIGASCVLSFFASTHAFFPCALQFPESLEARVQLLADVSVTDIAQRYKMQQVLGSGAQATVYQAMAKKSQRKTAIKVHSYYTGRGLKSSRGRLAPHRCVRPRGLLFGRCWTKRSWRTTTCSTRCAWRS